MLLLATLSTSTLPIGHKCMNVSLIHDCGDYLICNSSGLCSECDIDSDQCMNHFYCRYSKKQVANICNYEPLTHKWDTRLALGMLCVFIAGVFVSGAGIGGGGLYVPIMTLLVKFPTSYAIPTSKAIIFGGFLAVTLFNLNKRHPFYDRPLINYNVASMIEPVSWLGTIIGVIINTIIPEWLLYLVQFLLFSYTAWYTFKKGLNDQRKAKGLSNEILIKEKSDGPTYSICLLWLLLFVYAVFITISFLRGGDGASSIIGIKFCSKIYWALTFGPFPVYILITLLMIKVAKNYPVIGHKKTLSKKDCFMLMMSGFTAGIAAGFLGIGGGIIKGPMMLALEIEAEEMTATSTFMILMTASATSIQYIAEGLMPWLEFGVFTSVGFVSFLIGVIFLRWLVKKLGNRSIFLYLLAAITMVSAILMSVVGIQIVIQDIKEHAPMGFKPFC